jgi:hypothetical protein
MSLSILNIKIRVNIILNKEKYVKESNFYGIEIVNNVLSWTRIKHSSKRT